MSRLLISEEALDTLKRLESQGLWDPASALRLPRGISYNLHLNETRKMARRRYWAVAPRTAPIGTTIPSSVGPPIVLRDRFSRRRHAAFYRAEKGWRSFL